MIGLRRSRDGKAALVLDDRELPDDEIVTITAGRLAAWGMGIAQAADAEPLVHKSIIRDASGNVVNTIERSVARLRRS